MKIATLSLNPAIDRTVYCGEVRTGALNRAVAPSVMTHGGKGTNVSCALKQFGVKSAAYGFYGGDAGDLYMKLLESSGIDIKFTRVKSGTRINFKIIAGNGESTEFNEIGGAVEPEEKEELLEKIKRDLNNIDIFIMSGSIPPGIEKSIYRDIINSGGEKTKFILDCDGEAFKLCMDNANKKKPYIIKPNLFELEQYTGKKFDPANDTGQREIHSEAAKIYEETGVIVLCTLGEHGAVYCGPEGIFYCGAPKLEKGEIRGFAGAGDTFLAAFAAEYFGLAETVSGTARTAERALAFATVAAAAKVAKPGTEFPSVGEIAEMRRRE